MEFSGWSLLYQGLTAVKQKNNYIIYYKITIIPNL